MKVLADQIKAILAILVVLGGFGYFFVTYFVGKAQSDPQIIIAIVGSMTTVLAYYFGNSQGSSKKDDVISSMATSPSSTVTTAETVNVNQTKEKEKDV